MRGTLRNVGQKLDPIRFIPAGAGNTRKRTSGLLREPVHPRGCGEHRRCRSTSRGCDGSSPRVRGTLRNAFRIYRKRRFIPAGAGNTASRAGPRRGSTVHPRGCGEHVGCCIRAGRMNGSSPRVRGTRGGDTIDEAVGRFIPAGAGNTRGQCGCGRRRPVHPRGCGEHVQQGRAGGADVGSSPRVRGTQQVVEHGRAARRFIPAGAGNTISRPPSPPSRAVHPRGCGEHPAVRCLYASVAGSSPRVRGTQVAQLRLGTQARFIPAGAGNTVFGPDDRGPTAVHPRGCGEHLSASLSSYSLLGSSPRVRGTPACASALMVSSRFIPAGAGNTSPSRIACSTRSVHPRGCGEHAPVAC